MRVVKTDTFAGLPAPIAISFLREFATGSYATTSGRSRLDPTFGSEADALERLAVEGFVERVRVNADGDSYWQATISGNALAQAKIGQLITRATADRLLDQAITRAASFNTDDGKIARIKRLRVFGSYLDTNQDRIGDVDLAISVTTLQHTPAEAVAYARATGRHFNTYMDELFWAKREPILFVKNRARGLSVTTQNPATFTDRWHDIFADTDTGTGVAKETEDNDPDRSDW